jgi:hypothetical protein
MHEPEICVPAPEQTAPRNEPRYGCPRCCSARPMSDTMGHVVLASGPAGDRYRAARAGALPLDAWSSRPADYQCRTLPGSAESAQMRRCRRRSWSATRPRLEQSCSRRGCCGGPPAAPPLVVAPLPLGERASAADERATGICIGTAGHALRDLGALRPAQGRKSSGMPAVLVGEAEQDSATGRRCSCGSASALTSLASASSSYGTYPRSRPCRPSA